jgi:TetR/AcrR family transcriptional regulator
MAHPETQAAAQEPKWRRLPGERPQQILDAALEIFGQQGLANARLEDIAKRAGVSKGTVYLYFENKEELFREVIRYYVVRNIDTSLRETETGTPAEQLRAVSHRYWKYFRSPIFAVVHHLLNAELNQFPDLGEFYTREVIQPAQKLIAGVYQRGVDTGAFRQQDPTVATRMLISIFISHANWCSRRRFYFQIGDRSDEQVFQEMFDFYLGAVRVLPAGAPDHAAHS